VIVVHFIAVKDAVAVVVHVVASQLLGGTVDVGIVIVAVRSAGELAVVVQIGFAGRNLPIAVVVLAVANFREARRHGQIGVVTVVVHGPEETIGAARREAVRIGVEPLVGPSVAIVVLAVASFVRAREYEGVAVIAVPRIRRIPVTVVVDLYLRICRLGASTHDERTRHGRQMDCRG